jgi:hypothetical protein
VVIADRDHGDERPIPLVTRGHLAIPTDLPIIECVEIRHLRELWTFLEPVT